MYPLRAAISSRSSVISCLSELASQFIAHHPSDPVFELGLQRYSSSTVFFLDSVLGDYVHVFFLLVDTIFSSLDASPGEIVMPLPIPVIRVFLFDPILKNEHTGLGNNALEGGAWPTSEWGPRGL